MRTPILRALLAADDEAELLAIPRKQRAEVRKGLDKGLVIETGSGPRDLDWHYAVYSESVRNLGTPVFPKALMAQVLTRLWRGCRYFDSAVRWQASGQRAEPIPQRRSDALLGRRCARGARAAGQ